MAYLHSFTEYPSISNRICDLPRFLAEQNDLKDDWSASPKIHGSNFSVWIAANGVVSYARRGDFLKPGESFYFYQDVMARLNIEDISVATNLARPGKNVAFFGELHGGAYPHFDVPKAEHSKCVQQNLWYSPENEFVVFDVQIDGVFLDVADCLYLCATVGFPAIPIVFQGPAEEVVRWSQQHCQDNCLAWYNPRHLPLIDSNAGEGFVLRPLHGYSSIILEQRAVLKIKNPNFSEVATVVVGDKQARDVAVLSAGGLLAEKYLVYMRAAAVCSKESPDTIALKNIRELTTKLINDAKKDFTPEDTVILSSSVSDNKAFVSAGMSLMRKYISEFVTGI